MSDTENPDPEELFARWVEQQVLHGEAPDPEELCRDRPEMLGTLLEHIRKYERLNRVLDPADALEKGTNLLHYRIVEKLGAGGMGEVYLAEDKKLGRRVALKVLPPEMATDRERLERFRREARIVATLNHPNIVTIFAVEEAEGMHFLTMELVEGETLNGLIHPGGLEKEPFLEVAEQLVAALVAAHKQGVVHRDLKPANIMIGADGRTKILDFGLAQLRLEAPSQVDMTASTELMATQEGRVLGTFAYMSPEQARGEELDARTDLFSLGVILYELATGPRPFPGESPAEVMAGLLESEPTPSSKINSRVSQELERIILKCLKKERDRRYQSARELGADLDGLKGRSSRRRMGLVTVLAASVAALIVAVQIGRSPRVESAPTVERPTAAAPETAPTSVAVLPFADVSPEKDQEYFTDGLTEELLNVLGRVEGLRVAARTSSFSFKGKTPEIAEVGAKLNVSTILEGSVRKAGNRVRITIQLVNVEDGFHLWSQNYDRQLDDIFAVQDDIARSVAEALKGELGLGGETALASGGTNIEAYNAYLQGRYFSARFTEENLKRALSYYEEALTLDANYAPAWTGTADAYFKLAASLGGVPYDEGIAMARRAVERALELDEGLAEAHAVLGAIRRAYDWDWAGAEASFKRALALEPNNAAVLLEASALASTVGHFDEALALGRRAIELDPLNPMAYQSLVVPALSAGLLDESTAALEKALVLAPERAVAHMMLGLVYLRQSRPEEALREMQRETNLGFQLTGLSMAHHALGHAQEADTTLDALIEGFGDAASAYQIAEVYAYRGEADLAFEWLERAYQQRDAGLGRLLKGDPFLVSLEDDPRHAALLEKMGLAD